MIKKILAVILILLAILVILGLFLPKNYEVSRSIEINASRDKIHKYVGDLENWPSWTPWVEADPSINTKIGEKSKGVGASQSWTGKNGDGRLQFTRYDEDKGIAYDLFFMGDQNKSYAEMIYNEVNKDSVEVEWNMEGEINMPLVGGYLALMMDQMVGPMFEKGLENLKTVVESN